MDGESRLAHLLSCFRPNLYVFVHVLVDAFVLLQAFLLLSKYDLLNAQSGRFISSSEKLLLESIFWLALEKSVCSLVAVDDLIL